MKSKTWVIIAKAFAVFFALYGLLLVNTVVKEINMYNRNPEIYHNGLQGVLIAQTETIFLIITLVIGGILFMLNTRLGWILLGTGELIAAVVAVGVSSFTLRSGKSGQGAAIALVAVLGVLCLLTLVAMFSSAVRAKYKISVMHVVAIVIAAAALLAANRIW